MWIKVNKYRINLESLGSYYHMDGIYIRTFRFYIEGNMHEILVEISSQKVCEYLDMLYETGKYREDGMLVIDREFEERIKDVEFKTLDEFSTGSQ